MQDPSDFYAWTQSLHCRMWNVQFIFVSAKSCQGKANEVAKCTLRPIVGTMKLHAVAGKGNSWVSVGNNSCYCDICMLESFTCEAWRDESLTTTQQVSMPNIITAAIGIIQAHACGKSRQYQAHWRTFKHTLNDFVVLWNVRYHCNPNLCNHLYVPT